MADLILAGDGVNTPWQQRRWIGHYLPMKHKTNSPGQNQKPAGTPPPMAPVNFSENENYFIPAPDEVARRAYFSYVNQGSSSGHEVQHWLEAERQLLEERNRTRTHGYPHDASSHKPL